jgi:RimJ/RimL family protein N-acetyltransferase
MPSFLIFERTDGAPNLVGSCGLGRRPSGAVEMGYWIARAHWGRGYATEASRALIEIARTLGFDQLEGSHFVDNPASGRVLEKLGFQPLGITAPRFSCARGTEAPSRLLRLALMSEQTEDTALAA